MNFCLKAILRKYTTKARNKNVKSKIDFQLDLSKKCDERKCSGFIYRYSDFY